jgi:hypothetical protein
VAQLDDLVAPELGAHGFGHAERVDVDDAAADRELRNIFHHRHALEAHAFQTQAECFETHHIALAKLHAEGPQCTRKTRALQYRTRRRKKNPQLAARQPFECLDPFTGDLAMGLGFAKTFARRMQRNRE